jgi:type I restriction enzyme, S subunit
MKEIHNIYQDNKIMKLGEVCTYSKGKKPAILKETKTKDCSVPYINIKAFEKGIISEYTNGEKCNICNDDDLLMVWDGARCGLIGKAKKGAVGSTLMKILPKGNIHKEYLYHFISSKFWTLNTKPKGVGIPHIEPTLLWNFELVVPLIAKQNAIVAKIEELLSELENSKQQLQTAQQLLKVYRQSLLKWAFEAKLTNKNLNDGVLPKGWKWVKLGSIATKITDGEHITPRRTSEGFLLLSARNIQNGYLALENVDYVPEDEYLRIMKRCNPDFGDILISCSGTIGRVCRVPKDLKFVMVRSVALVKLDWEKYSSKFYEYLFQSPLLQRHIEKSKKATAQANLFLGPIKNLDVIVCPLEEQQLIVSELESKLTVCDKIEQTIGQSLQQAEILRQSILKKAFEGKLGTKEKTVVINELH